MLLLARHLAEGAAVAVGQEHRVVTEAPLAARRPDEGAVDPCLERLDVSVRPGDAERGNEMRLAPFRHQCPARAQLVLYRLHGVPKILVRTRPACRIDAGIAVERVDGKP